MAWYTFYLRQPLPTAYAEELTALAGPKVSRDGRSIRAGTNCAWLVSEYLGWRGQHSNVKQVQQPLLPAPHANMPWIPGMRERVSGFEHPWPAYLLPWQQATVLHYGHLPSVRLQWAPGCLSGEAELVVNRAGRAFRIKLAELVRKFNGGTSIRGCTKTAVVWDAKIPTRTQSRTDDGAVRLNEIVSAVESGVKVTYAVHAGGRKLRATADHIFITPAGDKRLSELVVGSLVYIEAGQKKGACKPKRREHYTTGVFNHPYALRKMRKKTGRRKLQRTAKVATHRLVAEAALNSVPLAQYIETLRRGTDNQLAGLRFIDPKTHDVHHKDGDWRNNAPENLEVITKVEHQREHGRKTHWRNVTYTTKAVPIEFIGDPKEEMTYDLAMAAPYHNFLANGFVVHNSGKTLGAILYSFMPGGPVLFVTRSAARRTIAADVKRFTTESFFILEGQSEKQIPSGTRVVITGWDTLPYHIDLLANYGFVAAVFDEIHRASSHKVWNAIPARDAEGKPIFDAATGNQKMEFSLKDNMVAAAHQISQALTIQRRMGTTATPIPDRLRNLWGQLHLLEPYEWGTKASVWFTRYCNAYHDTHHRFITSGRSSEPYIEELNKRLSFSLFSVPYSVTHRSLPPKRRQVTYIPKEQLLKDEGAEARAMLREAAGKGKHAMAHGKLAAAAARKRNAVVDLVLDSIGDTTKAVVLTGLRREAEKLADQLRKKLPGVQIWSATGDQTVAQRDRIREQYMESAGPCIIVGTLYAWGESVNLQDTDIAFIVMLPLRPGDVIQVEGRFSRQGQVRPTLIHYVVAEGTYDEHVASILLDKLPAVEHVVKDEELAGFGKAIAGLENETEIEEMLLGKLLSAPADDTMEGNI